MTCTTRTIEAGVYAHQGREIRKAGRCSRRSGPFSSHGNLCLLLTRVRSYHVKPSCGNVDRQCAIQPRANSPSGRSPFVSTICIRATALRSPAYLRWRKHFISTSTHNDNVDKDASCRIADMRNQGGLVKLIRQAHKGLPRIIGSTRVAPQGRHGTPEVAWTRWAKDSNEPHRWTFA